MPQTQPGIDILQDAVAQACRAPSIHNSQPWRWIAQRGRLELFIDADRLVATDRSGREALLSCGAVLDHLRVALAAAGWTAQVDRYPNPNDHRHLASVEFSPMSYVTDGHRRRAETILTRRTDRLPFRAPADWESTVILLRSTFDDTGALFDVLSEDVRPKLAWASQLTASLRQYDSEYHAELDWWTGPFGDSDGIPHTSLVSAAEDDRVDIGRMFPVTRQTPERRLDVPEDQSKILVVSARDDTRLEVLRCGEALSQVLLKATMAGLATCPLTHLTEVDVSREVVASLAGRDFPQVLIRVGTVPSLEDVPAPTPRRRLADVLEIRL